jgi:hypothetical protein
VVDPNVGGYCQIRLDSGERILVNHDQGGFKGGKLTIGLVRWWGLASGETLFTCDLDSPEGKARLTEVNRGVAPGSARATPLGAFVDLVKDCRTSREVVERCRPAPAGAH